MPETAIQAPLLDPQFLARLEQLELVSRKIFLGVMKGRTRRQGMRELKLPAIAEYTYNVIDGSRQSFRGNSMQPTSIIPSTPSEAAPAGPEPSATPEQDVQEREKNELIAWYSSPEFTRRLMEHFHKAVQAAIREAKE